MFRNRFLEKQSRLAGFPVYSTGMKTNPNKTTPRVYHTLRQIVQRIPRWLIEKTANAHGVDARKFSATSHFVMLILGHLSRASCLTEICDDADLNRRKLSLVRNATPGKRNTFSHANRTRPAELAEEVYWETARNLGEVSPDFVPPKRVRGFLSRFRDRGIFAIDSTVIKLALTCIASYPYRSRKAAAKMHARLPVGSFIPSVVRIEAGKPHDSTMADELTKDMKSGDILLADRAYVDFLFLHNLAARDVFWVLRHKVNMLYEVVERKEVSGSIISDEIVRLTAANTAGKYPQTFRRVQAIVEVNGEKRAMTFLTNNTKWAASTICELYRARWEIEVFFKELKQTLQLADFIGTNENAVKWQIWTGLLTHLLLHYLKFLSGWNKAFSRLVGIVRSAVWMDLDIVETLRLYGMASPPHRPRPHCIQPYLAGF